MEKRTIISLIAIQCLFVVAGAGAFAENYPLFDEHVYASLAGPDAPEIPAGTVITRDNWTKYQPYMTLGMQELYSGKFFYHIPPGISTYVGPTISIPQPWKYSRDTEKYAGQTKLDPLPTGGVDIIGYAAGRPFPHPSGPYKAMQILYNVYYQYSPFCIHNIFGVLLADRFNNLTALSSEVVNFRMNHLSEEGMGLEVPDRPTGMFQTIYDEVLTPEQSKYTTSIDMQPDDVKRVSELYVFLPSLRRSLRLSSAARCAPISGTDDTNDDNNAFAGIPTWFKGRYLGEHKILSLVHEHQGASRIDPGTYQSVGTDGFRLFWPKRIGGLWELRDTEVIDLAPLDTVPMARGYCYAHRVLYIDKEANIITASEAYDQESKLWKIKFIHYSPVPTGDAHGSVYVGPVDANDSVFDMQNNHRDQAYQMTVVQFNEQVPASFRDIHRYGTPSGLDQVMR